MNKSKEKKAKRGRYCMQYDTPHRRDIYPHPLVSMHLPFFICGQCSCSFHMERFWELVVRGHVPQLFYYNCKRNYISHRNPSAHRQLGCLLDILAKDVLIHDLYNPSDRWCNSSWLHSMHLCCICSIYKARPALWGQVLSNRKEFDGVRVAVTLVGEIEFEIA